MNTTPTPTSTMLPSPIPTTVDSLLTHADWVRALARHLVRDPQTADDVEQEVWREAIERPPAHGANPRGWLASVARNAARRLKRGDARRTKREIVAARPEALPSTSQLVEEASLSRELVGVVLQLDEPYRTTLLLRYFREMSVDDIATAQSLPRETVRTRQRRALEMLRERLDATRGGRASWLTAFAPLARFDVAPVASAGGGVVLAWTIAAAVIVAAGLMWAPWRDRASADVASVSPPANESSSSASSNATLSTNPSRTPVASVEHDAAVSPPPSSVSATKSVRGRVIDVRGRPMTGLELRMTAKYHATFERGVLHVVEAPHTSVEAEGTAQGRTVYSSWTDVPISANELEAYRSHPEWIADLASSLGNPKGVREALLGLPTPCVAARVDASGDVAFDLTEDEWELEVAEPHTKVLGEIGASGAKDWTLIVGPCVHVAGIVVDPDGAPVTNATLTLGVHEEGLRDLPPEIDVRSVRFTSESVLVGKDGRFDAPRAPQLARHVIEVSAPGHQGASIPVPAVDTFDLRVVLRRAMLVELVRVRGIVLDSKGDPVSKAWVQLGQDACSSDESGRFDIGITSSCDGAPLTAVKRGFQAAIVPDFGRNRSEARDDLVLQIGPEALSIRGRVTGPMGKPIGKAHVQVLDGTPYGTHDCFVEDAVAGSTQLGVITRGDGRFELGGLSNRTYRIAAWWDDARVLITDPIRPGTNDVVLTFDPANTIREVRGRVVSRHGEGLSNAEVACSLEIWSARCASRSHLFGRVSTDEHGNFVLQDVPKDLVRLSVSGDGLRFDYVPMPTNPEAGVTITATFEVRVELEVADASIDEVEFLDANGKSVHPILQLPGLSSQQPSVERKDGSFPPFDLTDDAVTAVSKHAGVEVHRGPVTLSRARSLRLQL